MSESIDKYVESICSQFGYTKEEFVAPRGNRAMSRVRNMVLYILHQDLGFSLSKISRYFDRQIRTIVIANATMKYRLKNNFSEEVELYNKCKKRQGSTPCRLSIEVTRMGYTTFAPLYDLW